MQYKDLNEMNIKDWDGQPFYAIVIDTDEGKVFDTDMRRLNGIEKCKLIVGYIDGHWRTESGTHWCHVYPYKAKYFKQKERVLNNGRTDI